MKALLLVVMLLFTGLAASAQPLTVRTGEHDDFTRVVVLLEPGVEWQFEEEPDGYTLRVATLRGFGISDFFALIPRTRIAAVSQRVDAGVLELTLACPCAATARLFRPGILVIDVMDRERAVPPAQSDFVASVPRIAGTFTVPQNPLLPLSITELQSDTTETVVMDQTVLTSADQSSEVSVVNDRALTDQVLRALGDGLSNGLLQIATEGVGQEILTDNPELPRDASIPGVIARSNIDVAVSQDSDTPVQTQTGATCLPDTYFEIQSWGDVRPFGQQISERRVAIAEDREGINEEQAMRLAQNFVYFGFGQEALEALALSSKQSLPRRVLSDVAKLLDQRPIEQEFYSGQISCDANVALWALLASGGNDLDGVVARDAILFHFKELPDIVQSILAPALANAFVQTGDTDASRQVLARSGGIASDHDRTQIAQSNLALANQDQATAVAILETGLSQTQRPSPDLMRQFFEVGLLADQSFQDEDFALSDAVRFEAEDSEAYYSLTQAQIRAHIASQDFVKADDLLSDLEDESAKIALRDFYAREAVVHMNDFQFGEFAWSERRLPTAAATRSMIADRLRMMGFDQKAAEVQGKTAGPGMNDEIPSDMADAVSVDQPNNAVQASVGIAQNVASAVADRVATSLQDSRDLLAASASLRQMFGDRIEELSQSNDP